MKIISILGVLTLTTIFGCFSYNENNKTDNIQNDNDNLNKVETETDTSITVLCNIIASYTPENKDIIYQSTKNIFAKGINADCDCKVEYSQRKYVSYIPIIKEFVQKKYRYYTVQTTPLILAIETGDKTLIDILLQAGAKINKRSLSGILPLEAAILIDKFDIIEYCIGKGADIKEISLKHSSNINTIKKLVAKGANPKTIDINIALENKQQLTELLKLGADVNANPLDLSIVCSNFEIAKLLIDNGLDINSVGDFKFNCTLIYGAIQYAPDDRLFDLLVEKGANLNEKCNGGFAENLLFKAISANKISITKKLIDKQFNINKTDWTQKTPIFYALEDDQSEMLRYVIDNKANKEYSGYFGQTPLMFSVKYNKNIAAGILIEKGANVNYINPDKESCLHIAINNNDLAMVKLLVENKINTNYKLHEKTYLEFAKEISASQEIISYLSKK